jgi:hypothetical protein
MCTYSSCRRPLAHCVDVQFLATATRAKSVLLNRSHSFISTTTHSVYSGLLGELMHLITSIYKTNPLKPCGFYIYHQDKHEISIFSLHNVFMYFVWLSEQTATFLHLAYSTNCLVLPCEEKCLYCCTVHS